MRLIGGQFRGMRLASVGSGDEAARLRPTPDRVRESLFNILASHGDVCDGARVLDLFAGTGALGLEALSRGSAHATFVDNGRTALRLISENLEKARVGDTARVLKVDATRLPSNNGEAATLVFLDPPYGKGLGDKALQSAVAGGWIGGDTLVVWEENAAQVAPDGFIVLDIRVYGDTHVTLLQAV